MPNSHFVGAELRFEARGVDKLCCTNFSPKSVTFKLGRLEEIYFRSQFDFVG